MAVSHGLYIEGGRKLRATLAAAGVGMTVLTAINKQTAGIVAARSIQTAPVGEGVGGHLRSTIRAGATTRSATVRVGNARKRGANPVHWGWHRRHIRTNAWVTQAAQDTEGTWFDLYAGQVDELLGRVKGV